MSEVLSVALIALIAAAIWFVVELVLVVRSTRPVIGSLKKTVDDLAPVVAKADGVLDQVKPVLERVDATLAQAQPAVVQIEPVLVQTAGAIGALTDDLERLDVILSDVSRATNMAGNAANAVNDAVGGIASRARGVFGRGKGPGAASIEAAAQVEGQLDGEGSDEDVLDAMPDVRIEHKEAGFFTYPQD